MLEWMAEKFYSLSTAFIVILVSGANYFTHLEISKPIVVGSDGWAILTKSKAYVAGLTIYTVFVCVVMPMSGFFLSTREQILTREYIADIAVIHVVFFVFGLLLSWMIFDFMMQDIAFSRDQVFIKKFRLEKKIPWSDIEEIYVGMSHISIATNGKRHRFSGNRRGAGQFAATARARGVKVRVAWVRRNQISSSA